MRGHTYIAHIPYFNVINFLGGLWHFGPTHPALPQKVTRISMTPFVASLCAVIYLCHICAKLSQRLIINIVKETFSAFLVGETFFEKYINANKSQGNMYILHINLTENWTLVQLQLHWMVTKHFYVKLW